MAQETESNFVLALEFGGQSIKAGAVDQEGSIVERGRFKLDQAVPLSYQEFFSELVSLIWIVKGSREFHAVGVGAPGPCDDEDLTFNLRQKPAYQNVNGRPLLPIIQNAASCSNVTIANDATVAAWGEIWRGGHVADESFVLLTLGTGLGSCFIEQGKPDTDLRFWEHKFQGCNLEDTAGTTKAMVAIHEEHAWRELNRLDRWDGLRSLADLADSSNTITSKRRRASRNSAHG